MESCEKKHLKNETNNLLANATIGVKTDYFHCKNYIENKQNFDFGAEIVNNRNESEIITKTENICEKIVASSIYDKENSAINKKMQQEAQLTDQMLSNKNVSQLNGEFGIGAATTNEVPSTSTVQQQLEMENLNELCENDIDSSDGSSAESSSYASDECQERGLAQTKQRYHQHQYLADRLDISDDTSTDSNYSESSEMSGQDWKPISARPINWVQKQIHSGANPRELLSQMLPSNAQPFAPDINDMTLWRILASMLSEPPRREKLKNINTFNDVIQLVLESKNIIVLTGAGVSVSCGIPDFRSSDGIYSRLAKDFPDLPDPQAMFDINYFSRDPRPFYKFAREIYPGQFKPSPCHRFIKLLEEKGKLLRNYTQNIDTLEQVAGIQNVIECHGSFATASCTNSRCDYKCDADAIRADIFAQRIPVCPRCQPNVQQSVDASEPVSEMELRILVQNGIMKPDIVFFGEGLPEKFHTVMAHDKDECDLLIVMGSSLKVRPVALIPSSIPANVPQILINREQLHHLEFDVELLGDSDVIINQLCHRLGDDWEKICFEDALIESKELQSVDDEQFNETSENETEDIQQLQDIDTQSIKSNESADINLRATCTYSDSGFESSTSSGVGMSNKATPSTINCSNTKNEKLLPPDLLREPPMEDAVDFCNPDFQPFTERLGLKMATPAATYTQNYRHLSIDSSDKDSGIQCDSSNSALTTSSPTTAALLPPNFADSGGTTLNTNEAPSTSTSASQITATEAKIISKNSANENQTKIPDAAEYNKMKLPQQEQTDEQREEQKNRSIADRLIKGTYYCHEGSAAYVFPGAQVSWYDSEEELESEAIDENVYDDEINGEPLSPLMPPSVEAQMVREIATTATTLTTATGSATTTITTAQPTIGNKRRSSDHESDNCCEIENDTITTCTETTKISNNTVDGHSETRLTQTTATQQISSPPPLKRKCDIESIYVSSPVATVQQFGNADLANTKPEFQLHFQQTTTKTLATSQTVNVTNSIEGNNFTTI